MINFGVVLDFVKTSLTSDDASKGYYYNSTTELGQFKWKVKASDTHSTDFASDILTDKWASGYSKNIDVRRQGGVAAIGGGSIQINNTGSLYQWLSSNGISLVGSRVKLFELDSVYTVLYVGVVSSISHNSKYITINYEDMGKYRNADLSRQYSTESNGIYPIVFGEIEKTKFANSVSFNCPYGFGGDINIADENRCVDATGLDYYFMVAATNHSQNSVIDEDKEGYQLVIESDSDIEWDNYVVWKTYIADTFTPENTQPKMYVRCEKGDGSDVIRMVKSVEALGTVNDPQGQFLIELTESIGIDDSGNTEWIAEQSFLKFYIAKYENIADNWESCKGWQDDYIYTMVDGNYINVPASEFEYRDSNSSNIIKFAPTSMAGWGSVSGWLVRPFTDIVDGMSVPSTPTYFFDLPSGSTGWYKASDGSPVSQSKMYFSEVPNMGASTSPFKSRLSDKYYSSEYADKIGSSASARAGVVWLYNKYKNMKTVGDEFYLGISFDAMMKRVSDGVVYSLSNTSLIEVFCENNFGMSGRYSLGSVGIGTDAADPISAVNNLKEGYYIDAVTPIDELNKNRWWHKEDSTGVRKYNKIRRTGFKLVPLTIPDAVDFTYVNIFIGIKLQNDDSTEDLYPYINIRQLALIEKISDIDISKGLYSKWWGRKFSTTDFGSDAADLITNDYDILNHICRLQNYEQDGIIPPVKGWGLEYISNYSTVINNSNTYGGLQYQSSMYNNNFKNEIKTITEGNTKKLKDSICKAAWYISSTNREGQECYYPMREAFGSLNRLDINLYNILDRNITISDRSTTDIFCTPYVQYNRDYATDKYSNRITINNVEQSSYDSSYVSGVTSDSTAEALWLRAKMLYDKYRIINQVPETMTKLDWVDSESLALRYIDNWLYWMGATSEGFIDRREINIKVPYRFAIDNNIDIGKLVRIDLPFIANTVQLNGMVTKVNYNLDIKNPSCKITAFVELKNVSSGDKLMLESGEYILQEDGSFILI